MQTCVAEASGTSACQCSELVELPGSTQISKQSSRQFFALPAGREASGDSMSSLCAAASTRGVVDPNSKASPVAATPSSALATRMPTTTALTTVSQTSERQSAHNLNLAGLASTPLSLTSMPSQGKQSVVDEDSESATWILLALGATLVAMCICMALQPFVTQRRVAKRAPSAVDYEQIPSLQAHRPDEDSDEAVGRTQV